MSDTTETPNEKEVEEVEALEYEEALTRYELVMVAATAIEAFEPLDDALMNETERQRRKAVIRKSMRIIHATITELYDEIFDETNS